MRKILLALIVALSAMSGATLEFVCLTNNSGVCSTSVGPGFKVEINDLGGGQVELKFTNTLSDGILTTALVDEGDVDFFSSFTIRTSPDYNFGFDNNQTLPGGNGNPYNFATDHGFDAEGGKGGVDNGINPGEVLEVVGTLNAGLTFVDILNGLATSATGAAGLRFGIHVQSLPGGFSEGLIAFSDNIPNDQVPEPGTIFVTAAGVALLAVRRFRS
jgi:hypothetical protein